MTRVRLVYDVDVRLSSGIDPDKFAEDVGMSVYRLAVQYFGEDVHSVQIRQDDSGHYTLSDTLGSYVGAASWKVEEDLT